MSLKKSTALKNAQFVTGSFKSLMDGMVIKIYTLPVPADADAALGSAALLCTITKDGDGSTGLTFGTASNGTLTKSSESWLGTNAASGKAAFWRMVKPSDTGGAAGATDYRVQGDVSSSSLILANLDLVQGAPQAINFCTLTDPS